MQAIEGVELRQISLPLRTPFETSFCRETDKHAILVSAHQDGARGWGEVPVTLEPYYSSEDMGTAWHILTTFLIPLAKEHSEPSEFAQACSRIKGHQMAKAGMEAALWDLKCSMEGKSLKAALGGSKDEVEVGVSVGLEADVRAVLGKVEQHLASGYRRVKLKIKPGMDKELLLAMKREHPDMPLQADANCAYRREDLAHLSSFDELDMLCLEQPFAAKDWLSHCALQKSLKTDVCLDESVESLLEAEQAIEMGACRSINIKPARVGGLTVAKAIHDLCRERGIKCWCGGMLETGVGRFHNLALASLPGFNLPGDISASERYFEEDILKQPIVLNESGRIDVPCEPAGVDSLICFERLERFTRRKVFTE